MVEHSNSLCIYVNTRLNEVRTCSLVSLVSLRSFECYAHSDPSQKTLQHLNQLNHSEFCSTLSSLLSSDAAPRILNSKFLSVPSMNKISMMASVWWKIFELSLIDLCLLISMDSKSTNNTLKLGGPHFTLSGLAFFVNSVRTKAFSE